MVQPFKAYNGQKLIILESCHINHQVYGGREAIVMDRHVIITHASSTTDIDGPTKRGTRG